MIRKSSRKTNRDRLGFAALALSQINAVPAENHAIESAHNEKVHDEMLELRNAIRNDGTTGDTKSVSVTLGTTYPSRSFSANPLDPTGFLETPGSTTLTSEPVYNEHRDALPTRIEHGFVDGILTIELADRHEPYTLGSPRRHRRCGRFRERYSISRVRTTDSGRVTFRNLESTSADWTVEIVVSKGTIFGIAIPERSRTESRSNQYCSTTVETSNDNTLYYRPY